MELVGSIRRDIVVAAGVCARRNARNSRSPCRDAGLAGLEFNAMTEVKTMPALALAMQNYATGANLRDIMYPDGADADDGIAAIDRLFENVDHDKDYLERRRAAMMAIALSGPNRWREALIHTSYPHQLAVTLMNAIKSPEPSRHALQIMGDWLGLQLEPAHAPFLLPVLVDAMFGSHWKLLEDVPCGADWRETFDKVLRLRPPFAAGILRGGPDSTAVPLPNMEFVP